MLGIDDGGGSLKVKTEMFDMIGSLKAQPLMTLTKMVLR